MGIKHHHALVGLVLAGNFFFSGVVFGWASLQIMLESEGVYREGCDPDPDVECSSQLDKLGLMYSIASTINGAASIFSGLIVDHFGPSFTTVLNGCIQISGALIFGLASRNSPLLTFAFALIGIAGNLFGMNSFSASFLVSPQNSPKVLSASNCLFDASATMFYLFFLLNAHAGISRAKLFLGYAVISTILFSAMLVLWCMGGEKTIKQFKDQVSDAKRSNSLASLCVPETQSWPIKRQLFSFEFVFLFVFAVLNILHNNLYLGTNKLILEDLGDKETGYLYAQIFVATLPTSVLVAPFVAWFLRKYGFVGTFYCTTVLGIAMGILSMIRVLQLQVLTFIVFTAFRGFFFSAIATYSAHTFGPKRVGRIHGTAFSLATSVSFLTYPAITLTNKYANGNFGYVNGILTALHVVCGVMVFLLGKRMAKVAFSDVGGKFNTEVGEDHMIEM